MPKSPRFAPNPVRVIDVVAYPAVQLLDVTGPVQVFASANDLIAGAGGARAYELRVVAQGGNGVTASAGVTLAAGPLSQPDEPLDTLLVAGGEGIEAAIENLVLVDWVRERATQARRVASVCTGIFFWLMGWRVLNRRGLGTNTGALALQMTGREKDRQLMRASLQPLTPGVYKVEWRAVGTDTHKVNGDFTFTVGE